MIERQEIEWDAKTGLHALHRAAREGLWEVLAPALAAGTPVDLRARAGDDKVFPHEGATMLHFAASGGHAETCALLAGRGAEVDARSARGDTPLLYAAFFGPDDTAAVIGTLLAHGADPNAVNAADGRSALHWLAVRGDLASMRLLLRRGAKVQVTEVLLKSTPLHAAALAGQLDAARLLLEAGCDPAHVDALGRTAADVARERGHEGIVALLAG